VIAAAAADGSPLHGAMIAVDAFELKEPAPPDALRGKAFFVLPGPGAGSTSAAEAARDWLTGAQARIRSDAGASLGDWESLLREAAPRAVRWFEEQAGAR
jgi:hypothetical protein